MLHSDFIAKNTDVQTVGVFRSHGRTLRFTTIDEHAAHAVELRANKVGCKVTRAVNSDGSTVVVLVFPKG